MKRSRPMSRLFGAVALCLVAMVALAPNAGAADPIKGKPRILREEGFAYPVDASLTRWRVGVFVVTRYPRILPSAFPERIRDLLQFRAEAKLKVFDGKDRIASRHGHEGLPVAIEGRSLYVAHLLLFSFKQSERILDAFSASPKAPLPDAGIRALAESIERARIEAENRNRETVARSHGFDEYDMPPPDVVEEPPAATDVLDRAGY